MNKKSINFNNKKFKKATSTIKNKKIIDIDDIDVNKILVPKKEQYGKNNSFKNTLLDIMIMILLDHYL